MCAVAPFDASRITADLPLNTADRIQAGLLQSVWDALVFIGPENVQYASGVWRPSAKSISIVRTWWSGHVWENQS